MTMALREAFAVLCILSIVVSPAISANDTNPVCNAFNSSNIASSNSSSNGNFTITVSPSTLSGSTVYTVTVNGSGNVSVSLQAISNSSSVGNWAAANGSCNGSLSYVNPFQNSSNTIVANWTSPNNISTVQISAYITGNTNVTISKLLDIGKLSFI
ncbi:placenta-expressed transcript 1 protein-like [Spea bombifrons]|uniref:placenta-expressed transcript 1 protein-like n=1 Tax=Spea bombifrons TaxID=233779 RepID=UPI00234A3C12|nr:placenta-expressed transcript 1 protein-like [Spea bombifrons]